MCVCLCVCVCVCVWGGGGGGGGGEGKVLCVGGEEVLETKLFFRRGGGVRVSS